MSFPGYLSQKLSQKSLTAYEDNLQSERYITALTEIMPTRRVAENLRIIVIVDALLYTEI